ncbi:nitronate monooxygenase [Pseudarthrobacter sp. N5]|uniref:nitronate monooxygenase n=1 Tax=Pseudarthrobacter sp. N5 TaxID=3418416 RepID=UPI003CFB3605
MPDAILGTQIVAAPMAGGTSTVAFIGAVYRAGGLGFLAAGYKTVAAMAEEIRQARELGVRFGLNIFVPDRDQLNPPPAVRAELERYRAELQRDAARFGVDIPPLRLDDDDAWEGKIDALEADPVELVSFTFGLPGSRTVAALKRAGTTVIATITSADEAQLAAEKGVDALVVQHSSAGGHSAAFLRRGTPSGGSPSDGSRTTAELVTRVRAAVGLPLIAAGGIMDRRAVETSIASGAAAAQLGTAFLRTDESGARQLHKDALADPGYTKTQLTRSFTGKQARALSNTFVRDHGDAPEGYPAIHHLTSPIRAAAAAAGDPERLNLWAGTGWRDAKEGTVSDVISGLVNGS